MWQLRLGHKNFKESPVDDGGDLSKLCQDEIPVLPSSTESGYGVMYTIPLETKMMTEKGGILHKEEKKQLKLFQNYQSELEEEEK